MTVRALTTNENNVLAHVAIDPVAWWTHVCSKDGSDGKRALDAEACLAAKVARWQTPYNTDSAVDGYQTRAEKEEE
tara:strand:+ start:2661 stop:2888 length:228 start_codon:yes stop_codon:yes gene_type:complete